MRVRLSAMLAIALFIATAARALAVTPDPPDGPMPVPPVPEAAPVAGFTIPVDQPLDLRADLLPGASRDYRGGTHEGIDFLSPIGTPVRAARAGTIARIDHEYVEWPPAVRASALAVAMRARATSAELLDRLRGRQVWIDHGGGLVSRYAHLSTVADLAVGDVVSTGDVIGSVGASGYPESGAHLHFEIRVGDGYLGMGRDVDDVRFLVVRAFSPAVIGFRDRE